MKRWMVGMILGLAFGATAEAVSVQPAQVEEVAVSAGAQTMVALPTAYGHLVSVVVSAGVHYLYFEDAQGVIRLVLIGPRGAMQRSRLELQLLSPQVYVVRRD